MKKAFAILLGLVFVAAVVGTGVFLYRKSQKKPVVYTTALPVRTDIVQKTVATGSVVPRQEVAIKPLVSGIVDELYVEEGRPIAKGAPVARVRVIPDMSRLSDSATRIATRSGSRSSSTPAWRRAPTSTRQTSPRMPRARSSPRRGAIARSSP